MNRMGSDPQRIKYAGQPTAQGVCEEVRYYLDRMEDLPIVDPQIAGDWENGREVPKGTRIFCAMGYNVQGDLCVEVYLRWLDEEEKTYKDDFFLEDIIVKENDLGAAARISAAIIKVFNHDSHIYQPLPPIAAELEDANSTMTPAALLCNGAGIPGEAGYRMTVMTLEKYPAFPLEAYRTACRRAVDTADPEKVMFLIEQAESHVADLPGHFFGDIAVYAYDDYPHMARKIIDRCTPQQAAAVPARLLLQAVGYEDIEFACGLVKKGVRAGELAECIIDSCYQNTLESLRSELLRLGMQVSPEDYGAMHSCLVYNFTEAAAILLERGMDFDACKRWAAEKGWEWPQNDTCTQIETMWAGMQTQSPSPTMQL